MIGPAQLRKEKMPPDKTSRILKFDVTLEQWKKLKAELLRVFKFPIQSDQSKVTWGSSVHDWDTGVFEWEYHAEPDAKPEGGTLEFRIRPRPFDAPETAIEKFAKEFLKQKG